MFKTLFVLWLLGAATIALPARADDGHDHDAAPAAPSGPALPRFAAASELFELVGMVDGRRLVVYLDHAADNRPVQGATLELEVGGVKIALKEHEAGEFEGSLAIELQPGVTPVTATVAAGAETDLLAAELDVHEAAHDDVAPASGWRRFAGWSAAAAVLIAAIAWGVRRAAARRGRVGGAA